MRNRPIVILLCTLSLCLLVFRVRAERDEKHGHAVNVSVQATDSSGGTIHYHWRSSDGQIKDMDSSTTSWTLPSGPGIHFAYVLVSNGLGGYTERRIAINTDTFRGDEGSSADNDDSHHVSFLAPPGPAQVGDYFSARSVSADNANAAGNQVYLPNVSVYLTDLNTNLNYPPNGSVTTDLKGEYILPGVPASTNEIATCMLFGAPSMCTPFDASQTAGTMLSDATGYYHSSRPSQPRLIVGTFTLQDGTPCGTVNEFFGVHATATATLLDASNHVLAGPVPVNELGDYALPFLPAATVVSLSCEGATPVTLPFPANNSVPLPTVKLTGVTPPTVVDMTATLHGHLLIAPVAKFQAPPVSVPSNVSTRADLFLAEKGNDSRLGACKYYLAVGAVQNCGPNGELLDPINYRDWQKAVGIGRFARHGAPTFSASYINKVDLNLARVHQSVSYGPDQTAAVVCNHLGAFDFFNPTQADIDSAVMSAVDNKNLVACVAMDYSVSPGANSNLPFIRFLIFGPNGQLLPSINLDGRREKYVPGTCVVCHGGDHYTGKFPEDNSGFANVGGHFLPYDVGNFEFASKPGLQKCEQEDAIYNLNQNVLNAGPTDAEKELIAGWYSTSGTVTCPASVSHVLNEDYVPPSWSANSVVPSAVSFYKNVIARSCRTCHVAMVAGYNFDHYENVVNRLGTNQLPGGSFDFAVTACGGTAPANGNNNTLRWYTMPNSLVTFNRFWLSYQNTVGLPDQPAFLQQFLVDTNWGGTCAIIPPQ